MKTFSELKIGERFMIVGLDGLDDPPTFYKISETEGYTEHGGHGRETVKPDEPVSVWAAPVVLHDQPTEVERAAFSVLIYDGRPRCDHIGLLHYILALVQDPNEQRDLDRYIWEAEIPFGSTYDEENDREIPTDFRPLRVHCVERGYVCWQREWDRDQDAFGAILDHKPRGHYGETRQEQYLALIDDAAARLAEAIGSYRRRGRPDGDQTHTVMGMGAPLLNVTTSLAAAIGEYHWQMLNIYATEQMDLSSALHMALPDDLISQTEAARLVNITPQAINNAIRERRLKRYATEDSIAHRPGDRLVSRAEVLRVWPPREA